MKLHYQYNPTAPVRQDVIRPNFGRAPASALKQHKIHLAIETTGFARPDIFKKLAPMFDLLLFDVKHYDRSLHYEGTHVHNELITENLRWAVAQGIQVLPHTPVIPGFNDSPEDAAGIASLLRDVGATQVQLLPFHQFGENKYHKLCREYAYENVTALHESDLACLRSTDNLHSRIAYHYEAKRKIAGRAARLISDGDTLMIESDSCCALLAEEQTASKKDLTIITNRDQMEA